MQIEKTNLLMLLLFITSILLTMHVLHFLELTILHVQKNHN